jgi:hypothetical protein
MDEYDKLQQEVDSYVLASEYEEPEMELDEYAMKTIEQDMENGIEIDEDYVEGFEAGFEQGAEDFKHDIEVEEEEKEWRASFCYGENCIYCNDDYYEYASGVMEDLPEPDFHEPIYEYVPYDTTVVEIEVPDEPVFQLSDYLQKPSGRTVDYAKPKYIGYKDNYASLMPVIEEGDLEVLNQKIADGGEEPIYIDGEEYEYIEDIPVELLDEYETIVPDYPEDEMDKYETIYPDEEKEYSKFDRALSYAHGSKYSRGDMRGPQYETMPAYPSYG